MAAEKTSDLLMKFVGDTGALAGETITELANSGLSKGFKANFIIEVDSFSFKTGIAGDESSATQPDTEAKIEGVIKNTEKKFDHIEATLKRLDPNFAGADSTYRRATQYSEFRKFGKVKEKQYPVDVKPVEFTRGIDKSSPELLSYLIRRRPLKSASLIKRRPAGGDASGEVFLRMDFKTVLLTKIDWSNDDPVKETYEFVCRAVCIRYVPQLPNGTLGAAIEQAWSTRPGEKATDIDR